MNDTKTTIQTISPRLAHIVSIINQSNGLTREEIQKEIHSRYPISKPTLIRDLNELIKDKKVRLEGVGRNSRYLSFSENPLLQYFDLVEYFQIEPDKRTVKQSTFDFNIFNSLHDIFTAEEMNHFNTVEKNFTKQTSSLPADVLKKELERFVIELSWKSSKIEGNTYSLLETETLILESKEAPGHQKNEAVMILNHKTAFDEIFAHRSDFQSLTVSKISQLHNTLTMNLSITPGLRKNVVGVTGTVYQPLDNQHQISDAMEKLVNTVNSTSNIYEKTLIAHVMIPYIQPYSDGNKRTGRMLTNALLLAHDLYPLSYRNIDIDEFKKALILFYEQQSLYHLKRLFIEQFEFANQTYFREIGG